MSHLGQRLSALIDGELDGDERDRVLVHLARCEPCRDEAIALRTLKRRMNALGEAAADSALTRRLMGLAQPGEHLDPAWSRRAVPAFWAAASSGRTFLSGLAPDPPFGAGDSSSLITSQGTPARSIRALTSSGSAGVGESAPRARLLRSGEPRRAA